MSFLLRLPGPIEMTINVSQNQSKFKLHYFCKRGPFVIFVRSDRLDVAVVVMCKEVSVRFEKLPKASTLKNDNSK